MLNLERVVEEDIRWVAILAHFFDTGFKSVEVDVGVEFLQVFLVVGLRVELEHAHIQLLDVLQVDFESDLFVDAEHLLVGLVKFQNDFL